MNSNPKAIKMFEAEIWTIDGSRKIIRNKYQPILNIKHVRQGCKIKNINELLLDTDNQNLDTLKTIINDHKIDLSNAQEYVEQFTKNICSKEKTNEDFFEINSTKKTKIIFEFMFNPVYLTIGSQIIINDQLIKAYGIVTKILK